MNAGIAFGLAAYLMWGAFPLYFRLLARIPALELVAHRIVWSTLLLAAGIALAGRWSAFRNATRDRRVWGLHLVTALLIAINWLTYVWGVNAGRVLECSLGYFLNPLVSVGLGVAVLRERLRPAQWVGVALAAAGIGTLSWGQEGIPWLSLTLAFSFGLYGLLKKRAPLEPVDGLFAETLLLGLPALAWIAYREVSPAGVLHAASALEWTLLAGTGIVTTGPLLLFSLSARRIPLSLVGLLQYITPTIQFLIGLFAFHESFPARRLHGFSLVWAGLALVLAESLWRNLRPRREDARTGARLPSQ